MVAIIIEGGQCLETWEPSSLRGHGGGGDKMEWLLKISNRGGSIREKCMD